MSLEIDGASKFPWMGIQSGKCLFWPSLTVQKCSDDKGEINAFIPKSFGCSSFQSARTFFSGTIRCLWESEVLRRLLRWFLISPCWKYSRSHCARFFLGDFLVDLEKSLFYWVCRFMVMCENSGISLSLYFEKV